MSLPDGLPVASPLMYHSAEEHLELMARQVLEEIATTGTASDVPLDEYIRVLADYRASCERRGNYKEAQLVQHVLKQLRLEEENRHVIELTAQQESERQGLEEAHMLEFQNFNRIWNEKIDQFEEHQLDSEAQMLERHSAELAQFHAEMAGAPMKRPKFSKELLNARKVQETLAKGKNYADAHKVKLKADQMEALELERINRERAERYSKQEAQILARHRAELIAMRSRMERTKVELERTRRKELELLIQRYTNVKRGMKGQQNIIKAKTGNLLYKHALNPKSDVSGSSAISVSISSGTFGPLMAKKRGGPEAAAHEAASYTELPPIR
eukprot:EG_transcript_13391